MKVLFRVDSSKSMGIGHTMRCLALAEELNLSDAQIGFVCRNHEGNIFRKVEERGFFVHVLPINNNWNAATRVGTYKKWVGEEVTVDANKTAQIAKQWNPDWIVVDHYGLDASWEKVMAIGGRKILVIDDLANRLHHCDILLDQTEGCSETNYSQLVPDHCKFAIGAKFALLRPEFRKWRQRSLSSKTARISAKNDDFSILISMGGTDPENYTEKLLNILEQQQWGMALDITIVMGKTAIYYNKIAEFARQSSLSIKIVRDATNMAELIAKADIGIGAAGATSWERCCLGLPTIQLVMTENQRVIARNLQNAGAAVSADIDDGHKIGTLLEKLMFDHSYRSEMVCAAAAICDGKGTQRIVNFMKPKTATAND